MIESINPTTGHRLQTYEPTPDTQVERLIEGAHSRFCIWRHTAFTERAELIHGASQVLQGRREELAELMAKEMGKPIVQGRAEVDKCCWVLDYYADHAEIFLAPELIETDARRSFVTFQPLGVVLAVMPWNFPLWQVFRFAAPALMAGNVALLKHASNVPGSALAIEDVFRQADFPEGAFQTLLIGSDRVSAVIRHPHVQAVTLTGSTPAGRAVAAEAGAALKKTVLELGGSDPYIVLEDADLEEAVNACATSRLINSGQSCIAAKRFIVPRSRRQEFEDRLVEVMMRQRLGDPLDEATDIGPLARHDLRAELHEQVERSCELGAECLLGGTIPDSPGAFYPATVLTQVSKGMPAYEEELFGPVAAIIPVANEEEAIRTANDTTFGLGAAIFTRDTLRGEKIASTRIDAGSCFVNAFVRSDPRLPFGGIKASGYGRELSHYGIREFVNVKTVFIA